MVDGRLGRYKNYVEIIAKGYFPFNFRKNTTFSNPVNFYKAFKLFEEYGGVLHEKPKEGDELWIKPIKK